MNWPWSKKEKTEAKTDNASETTSVPESASETIETPAPPIEATADPSSEEESPSMSEVSPTESTPVEAASTEAAGQENDKPELSSEDAAIQQRVVDIIKTVYDPEIPVDIYALGLIYEINVADGGAVDIKMTLTSPACPAAGSLPPEVETKVGSVEGVSSAKVEVVWEPTWTPEKMSEAAKLQLGMF